MIRNFVSSMRQVLPPAMWLVLAVMLYLMPIAASLILTTYVDWTLRPSGQLQDLADLISDGVNNIQGIVVFLAALTYGGWRAVANHPAFRPAYNQWLQLTPWRFGMTLPLGPITLVPADVIVFGVLSLGLIYHFPIETPATIFLAIMFVYLPLIALGLHFTDQRGACYAILASLAVYPQLYDQYVLLCVCVGLIYIAAHLLVRESLRRYPWDMHRLLERRRQMRRLFVNNTRPDDNLGWPYEMISLNDPKPMISYFDGICVSLLAGWAVYNVSYRITSDPLVEIEGMILLALLIGMLSLFRLVVYCNGHHAPISLFGRLTTGRLIIPKFDIVLVAPAVTCLVGWTILTMGTAMQWPASIVLSLMTAAVLSLVINLGPWRSRWRLVGAHRLTPSMLSFNNNKNRQQEFAKL